MLHKYSIVQNFKEPMKATEATVDIVLKFPQDVCSEVFGKVVACQHGIFLIVAD